MSLFSAMLALSSVASAGSFALIEDESQRTDELQAALPAGATVLVWDDVQAFPLVWEGVTGTADCPSGPVDVAKIEEHLTRVESALAYLETANAAGHLRQFSSASVCVNAPLPASMLARAAYLSGMASFTDGDVEAARSAWRQAFLISPELSWDDTFEPSGKSAFEDVRTQLGYEPAASLTLFPRDAEVLWNGAVATTGASVLAGSHLVQHPRRGHATQRVEAESGVDVFAISFADFPAELSAVMADETARGQLLRGLRILEMADDPKVVAGGSLWTVPKGVNRWTSQPWGAPSDGDLLKTETSRRSKRGDASASGADDSPAVADAAPLPSRDKAAPSAARPLRAAGLGSVALGAAALGWSWVEYRNFQDFTVRTAEAEQTWSRQRALWFTGVGLTTVGAGLVIGGTF